MWLSNDDLRRLFIAAVTADPARWPAPAIVVNGVSFLDQYRNGSWGNDVCLKHRFDVAAPGILRQLQRVDATAIAQQRVGPKEQQQPDQGSIAIAHREHQRR
ncbi:hypothetical protein [Ralstonia solanacearum]|uniref:hypothetical protein n=1 Tax=Ralstonia solanacearum TaxID=305 RepID=UPI001F453976|nr:hypothetical protein [Ralstonia solanacearum]